MLTTTKKKCKTIWNFEKKGPKIWWTGSFIQNVVLIRLAVSEKTGFTDGRRTSDARVTTAALLCSSTKQS